MDINFISDPNLIPKPRKDIRVEEINAQSVGDGRRIYIELRVTPFGPADRPSVLVEVYAPDGKEVGSTTVIETMHASVAMNFHIREETPQSGLYTIRAGVYFDEDIVLQGTLEVKLEFSGDPA